MKTYKVTAQFNNGDPCPKRESRAWDYENKEFTTLTEVIAYLMESGACGFLVEENGVVIAEHHSYHYPSTSE